MHVYLSVNNINEKKEKKSLLAVRDASRIPIHLPVVLVMEMECGWPRTV
jgi:hypothetical protein